MPVAKAGVETVQPLGGAKPRRTSRRRLDLLAHRARIVTDRDGAAWSEADCSLEDAACGRRDGTLQEYRNN